jgi:major membrane immunogen (membrane-anchored lipoprotein)
MKTFRNIIILTILSAIILAFSIRSGKMGGCSGGESKANSGIYPDGTYKGQSRGNYNGETYWGHVQFTIVKGEFTVIQFAVRDSAFHEPVDSLYGVIHFSDNPMYMQQCVEEEHGIENYPKKLLELQDIDKIDAVTGATWSYNIFIASAEDALKNAKK